jgi:type IV pilus assembly protein PilW
MRVRHRISISAQRRGCVAKPPCSPSRPPAGQRGTTLIELVIAMTVALLVLGTVGLIFGGTSRNRASLERAARLNENAHYAMDVMRNDIAQAGYYDTLTTTAGGFTWQLRDPCATALADLGWSNPIGTPPPVNAKLENAPVPIFGIRAADATPVCIPDRKPDTAIVVVRYVGPDATEPAKATGAAFLQLSKCELETPNKLNLGVVSNDPATFTMHNIDCGIVADVKRFVVRAYYVANCDRCGIDTIPTLKRAELVGNEIVITPLAEGVEDLQVEYGIDANGDGTPDRYLVSPDPALGAGFGEWSNVIAVRLYLLARSADVEPGYKDTTKRFNLGPAGYKDAAADGHKRVLLTSLVRPMNPAGQRETQ